MSSLNSILTEVGITPSEMVELEGRDAEFLPIPEALNHQVKRRLEEQFPAGIYTHQGRAIQSSLNGNDVCLATSTASGKSTVFSSIACHKALEDPDALTLAIYPARALVQDQLEKWKCFAEPIGIKVGQIDGSIPVGSRMEILKNSQVLVMTPDVVHAWLLGNSGDTANQLKRIRLVVLDEAHCYNGVFGTNMAYMFRRLSVLSGSFQLIASTATIGEPTQFLREMTGRDTVLFSRDEEGSQIPNKRVLLAPLRGKTNFESLANLLRTLSHEYQGKFLAFADSRKVVERLTAAAHRGSNPDNPGQDEENAEGEPEITIPGVLMPYRAGYESGDREEIQRALSEGRLRGVVTTSALELGIDIGDIDLVVLLNTPPSIQAFWQRFGRAGRSSRPGECLVVDDAGTIAGGEGGLSGYLERPVEPNYLYLGNQFVQYSNALCASREVTEGGAPLEGWNAYGDLPESFLAMLENEIDPTQPISNDLYPLKQRGENGPHYEFPIRGGIEASFQVTRTDNVNLGTLSMAQWLREAYPGAVYYYRATPYRIRETRMYERTLRASREKFATTQPIAQVTVFPSFVGGGKLKTSPEGFLQECDVQVAERVIGFTEKRGANSTPHTYGVGSPWAQRPMTRFFQTTGVVWSFGNTGVISEGNMGYLVDAFCLNEGIHSRDIGFGRFSSKVSPVDSSECRGLCIYDDVAGGLRLTERLAERFGQVLETAILLAETDGDSAAIDDLMALAERTGKLTLAERTSVGVQQVSEDEEWIEVIAPGQKAVVVTESETIEVTVIKHVFTPTGLKYRLRHPKENVAWTIEAGAVTPINGETQLLRYNLDTGEEEGVAVETESAALSLIGS